MKDFIPLPPGITGNLSEFHIEIIKISAVSLVFIIIFGVSKLVSIIFPGKKELSRKAAHLLGGLTALSFPYIFINKWSLVFLASVFLLLLILTRLLGVLKSVHGVERKSIGSFLFPVSILIVYLLSYDNPIFYFISILVLAISDTAAALVGGRYGSIKFEIEGNLKSLEGAISFSFITFLCVHIPLLLMTNMPRLQCVLIGFIIALVVCGFELVSIFGTDNIFVPLGVYYIAERMSHYPSIRNFETVWQLFLSISITFLLYFKVSGIKPSWIIGMILLNFASYSLQGINFFFPLIIFNIMLAACMFYYRHNVKNDKSFYKVKAAYYVGIIPAIIMFLNATFTGTNLFFIPLLTSLAIQITLIASCYFTRIRKVNENFNHRELILTGLFFSFISSFLIAGFTLFIFNIIKISQMYKNIIFYLLSIFISVLLTWILNQIVYKIYYKNENDLFESKNSKWLINLICTAFGVILVFCIQYLIRKFIL